MDYSARSTMFFARIVKISCRATSTGACDGIWRYLVQKLDDNNENNNHDDNTNIFNC